MSLGKSGKPNDLKKSAHTYLIRTGRRLSFGHTIRIQDRINTYKVHAGDDIEVLDTTEFPSKPDAIDAERKLKYAAQWLGLVTAGGKETMEDTEFAKEVYRRVVEIRQLDGAVSSVEALNDNPIGPVDPDTVDRLLSADGIDMWDESVADEASIPSLLVAHRVAGARQETWRTRLIAEAVQEREGTVTEEDIPDETMAEVDAEVERRLETATA